MNGRTRGSLSRPVLGVVSLCHALVIATAVGLAFYAHPQIDDLYRAGWAHRLGLWGAVTREYHAWSGRWLGTGLSFLLSSLVDVRKVYGELLLAIMIASAASFAYLLRGVMPHLSRWTTLLFSIVLMEVYWTGLETPGETFYWMTGGLENLLGLATPMLLVGLLVRTPADQRRPRRLLRQLGLVAAAVAATGYHELYSTMLVGLLAIGTAVAWLERRESRWEWGAATVGAVIGWLIVYSAPGNARRIAATPGAFSTDLESWLHVFKDQAIKYTSLWLPDVRLHAATLAFVLHPSVRALRPAWSRWTRWRWRWLTPVVTVGLLVFALATHTWLTARSLQPRTAAALYLVFLVGWFTTVFAWTRFAPEALPESLGLRRIAGYSTCLLAVALALAPATTVGRLDLRLRARPYDAAMRQRYQMLDGAVARGEKNVVLPPLPPAPRSFFDSDITRNPKDFHNQHTRVFYGLDSVVLR